MSNTIKISIGVLIIVMGLFGCQEMAEPIAPTAEMQTSSLYPEAGARTAAATAGWASSTGYQAATTPVQRNVVRLANAAIGGLSGFSVSDTQGKWLTDCAEGDGSRMRSAISKYDRWYRPNVKTRCASVMVPTIVRKDMAASFSGSDYDPAQVSALVNQIINRYNSLACNSSVTVPASDNATLAFLNIQKQCLEWAETIGRSAGGGARGYSAAGVASRSSYRPGMGLYKPDVISPHSVLIVDIYWNSDGSVGKFKIAESNGGSGWVNPFGNIPWERRVTTREMSSFAGYKVISFE